ncbi:MAG: LemA family protein [Planctomycetota bacterium]
MTFAIGAAAVAAVLLAIVASVGVRVYNVLVDLDQFAQNSFAQIQVQLKRRYDLIPNLAEAAKSFLTHERETLEAVIAARQSASSKLPAAGQTGDQASMQSWMGAESALTGALGRFSMVIEAYPELKANETVSNLMEELTSTENRISYARQLYNDSATNFNIRRRKFPAVLFAGAVGYSDDLLMIEFDDHTEIQSAPRVNLNENTEQPLATAGV